MLIKLWFKDIIIDEIWEFPVEDMAELMMNIIGTLMLGIFGLMLVPLDIMFSPLYLLYWLLSKIKLN